MAGGRTNGTSLGVSLCAPLIGSAVVVGVTGSPLALSHRSVTVNPSSSFQTGVLSQVGSSGGKQGWTYGATVCMVASLPPQPKGVSNPANALLIYLRASKPQWPTDGWSASTKPEDLVPHVRFYEHASLPGVSVLQNEKGLWAVLDDLPKCLPTPKAP